MFQSNFLNCDFESVGNGAIHSEAQSDGGGVLQGCTFVGGWNDYNDDYRIGALNKDYFVNVPLCHYNLVDWGAQPWPTGDEGIIICGGTGAWTLRGIGTWPETTSVITGPTLYNALDPVNLTNYTVTIDPYRTAKTFNYDGYLKAAGDALRPLLIPRSDPGGRFWVTRNSTSFTVTREGNTAGAVTFDIQF